MVDPDTNPTNYEGNGPVSPNQAPIAENAIVPSTRKGYEERAIVPYNKRRNIPAELRSPVQSIRLATYFIWKLHGFTPKQTADIVRSAWDENRNMIRERQVGEKFLEAMEEVMGDELDSYAATPQGFTRLKDIAAQIQRSKDMLMTVNISPTYRDLVRLRGYEPEEIVELAVELKSAGCKYPLWVLARLNETAEKEKISLENLVDRRLHQGGSSGSGFEDLDYMIDGEE